MTKCTCDTSKPAFCPEHRCDCNIWCGHRGMIRPHIFAPGEWCGGNDKTWRERRPGGKCRVHEQADT
jgi:hypothetical protein